MILAHVEAEKSTKNVMEKMQNNLSFFMNPPIILTNFKNYPSAIAEDALELAKIHARTAQETGVSFGIAVNAIDLEVICKEVGEEVLVFAQHIDPAEFGASTGKIIPEYVKRKGAVGTLLNHSENRFASFEELGKAIQMAKKAGLFTVVCAKDDQEGKEIALQFSPDCIAVEPPELIGGDISVSTSQPELVEKSVQNIAPVPVLVGAGIKNGEDVRIALSLGAKGVLLASGVTKSEHPKAVLQDLVSSIQKWNS
jgi:triosephosphate isomerase (TIM)